MLFKVKHNLPKSQQICGTDFTTGAYPADGQWPGRYWRYKNLQQLCWRHEYRLLQEIRDKTAIINEDNRKQQTTNYMLLRFLNCLWLWTWPSNFHSLWKKLKLQDNLHSRINSALILTDSFLEFASWYFLSFHNIYTEIKNYVN